MYPTIAVRGKPVVASNPAPMYFGVRHLFCEGTPGKGLFFFLQQELDIRGSHPREHCVFFSQFAFGFCVGF